MTSTNPSWAVKIITFETNDKPQAVQDYYKGVLQGDGWQLDNVPVPATPYSLYFSWRGNPEKSVYTLDLIIESGGQSGATTVEIKVKTYGPL